MRIQGILLLFLFISCGDDRFERVEELKSFRIVAIQATNPEVAPGGNTSLRLFVSDVHGGGRIINGTYEACIDPGISFGAEVSCERDPTTVTGAYVVDTTVPDLANNRFTGFAGTINVTVPPAIFTGRSSREQFNGVGYIVIFRFSIDGETTSAFKRIIATNRGSFNTNPNGGTILLNGAPIARIPAKDDVLRTSNLVPENYSYINIDGSTETRAEDLEVGWYVSEGKLDRPKSDHDQDVKYLDESPASLLLLAVIRDDRGGVEVLRVSQ